ncbi:MAG: chemotaxis-specific protein-glutamate methyltransferase CheB [Acidobacteriota bacterium]|nr:chemotaxis-specific protein-glutamate methyltransferase CheB [Acidobacteriota bacterium]
MSDRGGGDDQASGESGTSKRPTKGQPVKGQAVKGQISDGEPMRVVVVDDSSFVRRAITRMLENDDRIEIVGQAATGEELITRLEEWNPDAITLDLSMPGMGGLQTLDHIMAHRPTPVIILSTHSAKDAPLTIEALHRGATDFIDKQQYSLVDFEALRSVIVQKLLHLRGITPLSVAGEPAAEEQKARAPVAETRSAPPAPRKRKPAPRAPRRPPPPEITAGRFDLLLVGASTGGPPTIQRLLEDLGPDFPLPVVIVQHMPKGFTSAFAERLNAHLPLHVREASDGEALRPATVYIAPAGLHLKFRRRGGEVLAVLDPEPAKLAHRPSVDVMLASAAQNLGRRCLAVLLTGMGSDGAAGMLRVRDAGGYTVGQDAASCVVYGMPRAAANLNALVEEVGLDALGIRLRTLLKDAG